MTDLRARVQALIARAFDEDVRAERDALLAEAAQRQAAQIAPFGRLVATRGGRFDAGPDGWPALPTDVLRFARIAMHPPEQDVVVFRTSGTTSGARGAHALAHLSTTERAAEAMAARALFAEGKRALLMLAPTPREAPESSLSFMLGSFETSFGTTTHWAWHGGEIDLDAVERAARGDEALGVCATSFALVHLLDRLAGRALPLPAGSFVMQTGGFKGRSREVDAVTLRGELARTFALPAHRVVSEYGMTELSSQLYGDGLVRGALAPDGLERLIAPPWMRVTPCDPESLRPVPEGEVGVLRFDDLANLDACVSIQTADLGRKEGERLVLLGRAPGATPRGCSLAIEEALEGRGER
ncbi:MAG: acyl-protein synthetase [Sandaracinus sp.]